MASSCTVYSARHAIDIVTARCSVDMHADRSVYNWWSSSAAATLLTPTQLHHLLSLRHALYLTWHTFYSAGQNETNEPAPTTARCAAAGHVAWVFHASAGQQQRHREHCKRLNQGISTVTQCANGHTSHNFTTCNRAPPHTTTTNPSAPRLRCASSATTKMMTSNFNPGCCRRGHSSTAPQRHPPATPHPRLTPCFQTPRAASFTLAASATRCLLQAVRPGQGPWGGGRGPRSTSRSCRYTHGGTKTWQHAVYVQGNAPAWLPDLLKTAMDTHRDGQGMRAQERAHPVAHELPTTSLAATVRECLQHMVNGAWCGSA